MSRFKFCSSGVCLCLLLTPALMLGQEAARLAVTVLDPSDAAVPGAKVTVVEKGRGATHAGETEVTGTTYFNALNPGSYRVEVEKTGFEKYTVEDLQLHARDFQSLRLQVRVAAAEKSEVTVKGEVEGVQIDPSTGTIVNGRFAADIPTNARSIQSLVLMAPGVIYAGGQFGDVNTNGLRSNTNYYTWMVSAPTLARVRAMAAVASLEAGNGLDLGPLHHSCRKYLQPDHARCTAGIPHSDFNIHA